MPASALPPQSPANPFRISFISKKTRPGYFLGGLGLLNIAQTTTKANAKKIPSSKKAHMTTIDRFERYEHHDFV